jgi:hypothetical protein
VELHQIIFFTLMAMAICYAGLRGGAPERITAMAMVLALGASLASTLFRGGPVGIYSTFELGVALTDLLLFLVIVVIALMSARFWPILMAGMMGCGLLGHLTKLLGHDILTRAYYVTVAFWSYPELVLLMVAVWRHQARLNRFGVDHAWVWQLPPRYQEAWSVEATERSASRSDLPETL